jgi:ribonuclease BN (tRNA processing enzyme)
VTDHTVTVLGCDGSYPGPGGAASGYLVQGGATRLWLDAGPGTFAALQRVVDPAAVDAIVLSHEHPDHWTDLESFAVWHRQSAPSRPAGRPSAHRQAVPIYAPPGLRRRSYFADDPLLGWQEIGPSHVVTVGQLTCRFVATDHGPPTLAVRVDSSAAGHALPSSAIDDRIRPSSAIDDRIRPSSAIDDRIHLSSAIDDRIHLSSAIDDRIHLSSAIDDLGTSFAYSADSGPDWSVDELGHGIGTVLCEATFTRRDEGASRHMSGRQAGQMAAAAGVGRLLVTHRWPTVSADEVATEAADAFGRDVDQAAAGRVFEW